MFDRSGDSGTGLTRVEAADRLAAFVDQLRAGTVTIKGGSIQVPDQVFLEIEAEDGEIEFEVKWGIGFEDEEEEEEIVYGGSEDEDDEDDEEETLYPDIDEEEGTLGGAL